MAAKVTTWDFLLRYSEAVHFSGSVRPALLLDAHGCLTRLLMCCCPAAYANAEGGAASGSPRERRKGAAEGAQSSLRFPWWFRPSFTRSDF